MNDVHHGLLVKQQCFLKHVHIAKQRFKLFFQNLNKFFVLPLFAFLKIKIIRFLMVHCQSRVIQW